MNASELWPVGKYHIALGRCRPAVSDGPDKSSFLFVLPSLLSHCHSHQSPVPTAASILLVDPNGKSSVSKRHLPSPVATARDITIKETEWREEMVGEEFRKEGHEGLEKLGKEGLERRN